MIRVINVMIDWDRQCDQISPHCHSNFIQRKKQISQAVFCDIVFQTISGFILGIGNFSINNLNCFDPCKYDKLK